MSVPSTQFLTLLALRNFLDSHSETINYHLKSKKQYRTFIESLLDMLCGDTAKRMMFVGCGGYDVTVKVNDDGKVIEITEEKRWVMWRCCSGSQWRMSTRRVC